MSEICMSLNSSYAKASLFVLSVILRFCSVSLKSSFFLKTYSGISPPSSYSTSQKDRKVKNFSSRSFATLYISCICLSF